MKTVTIHDNEYVLEREYKDAFVLDEFQELCTDYFADFDYIFGDYAYGKLRLKGYRDKGPKTNKVNDIKELDNYIKHNCAFECKYFLLAKKK